MAEFLSYFAIFLLVLVSTLLLRSVLFRKRSLRPPGPRGLPIIGHLHLLAPIPHQALHKLSNRHGPLIHLFLGSVPCVVASCPETAKEFLKTHEASFSDRPQTVAVDFITYGSQDFSFAPYGPYWKFMKKLCMTELLGGRTLDVLLPLRREEIRRVIGFFLKKAKAGEAVDVGGELIRMANNVISMMMMSERCCGDEDEESAGEVRKLVEEVAELTGRFNLSDYVWFCRNLDLQGIKKRLRDVRGRFDSMMGRIIEKHREERRSRKKEEHEGRMKDLLDMLLDISEDENSEIKLTMENIKAFILVNFI